MLSVFTLAGKPNQARNPDAEEIKKLKYLKKARTPRLTHTLVAIQKRRNAVGERTAHHQNRRRDTGLPKLDPLGNRGDTQTARAASQEYPRDAYGAMSVGVGFDDGEDDAGSDTTRNLLKVLTEGGKRNLGDSEAQISVISASFFFRRSSTFAI